MQTTSRILAVLRVSLHLLVAVLLLVGMLGDFTPLALLFAAVYLAGTVAHNRGMEYSARASWAPYRARRRRRPCARRARMT